MELAQPKVLHPEFLPAKKVRSWLSEIGWDSDAANCLEFLNPVSCPWMCPACAMAGRNCLVLLGLVILREIAFFGKRCCL